MTQLYRKDEDGNFVEISVGPDIADIHNNPPYTQPQGVNQEVMHDILSGPPEAGGSSEPDYRGSPGESIPLMDRINNRTSPLNAQPNLTDMQNIRAKFHQLEERMFAIEELIRKGMDERNQQEIRLLQLEDKLKQPGMKI